MATKYTDYGHAELKRYHRNAIKALRGAHKGCKVSDLGWGIRVSDRATVLVSVFAIEGDERYQEHTTRL